MRLNELHTREIDEWIARRHYLGCVPAGAVLRLEFVDDKGERIGAMLWGRPVSPKLDQTQLLELTRMYFIDDTDAYAESRALGMARKYIRVHKPQIKGLITYVSTEQNHTGAIFRADNWFELGRSGSPRGGWSNRKGRIDRDLSPKIRFARSS